MYRKEIGSKAHIVAGAYYLRMMVFVEEQQIKLMDEFDSIDNMNPPYIVYFDQDLPIATGRYQFIDNHTCIEPDRLCVHPDYRTNGLGSKVLNTIEKIGRDNQCLSSKLSAEITALKFYEKKGYQVYSEPFTQDGIPCVKMIKML
ncbi:GNAT family N-acetyltransferase [Vagococcus silagei]|uniref:GNAT family N-acetyltransferase n=1 Tax=Vagococcus silagei TaxID=2508885 RepID=A0A4S3B6S0_9ENTE|nr:GNAT family N-acetyltransferase [Vagococcus silagei]THB61640.1 GNAT family N-acetyltransferase [Vagococcus silagei]